MKSLLVCAAILLIATDALAGGVDLSVGACPGNPGVANHATLDCAAGKTLTLLVTFLPEQPIYDLVGIDIIFDLDVAGDLGSNANFWEFSATNPDALGSNHARPAAGCSNYFDTWSQLGSGTYHVATMVDASRERIDVGAYRPGLLSVQANQPLFGARLTIDASTSVESGSGTSLGCPRLARMQVTQATPGTVSGDVIPPLTHPAVFGTEVVLNDLATPALPLTWGRLKSLYR